MIRIGFDASVIRGQLSGVEYYALRLLAALRTVGGNTVEVVPFSDRPAPHVPDAVLVPSILPRLLWRQFALPRAVRAAGVQSFHSPVTSLPLRLRVPVVATIHDIGYILCPDCYGPLYRRTQRFWLGRALRRAAGIACDSDTTRRAVAGLFPEAAPRLHTAHNGAIALTPLPSQAKVSADERLAALGVCPPFALVVGRIEPRKNPVNTLHAFLAATAAAPWNTMTLVFAGAQGTAFPDLVEAVRIAGAAARVRFCRYLDASDVTSLYRAAEVLLYLSFDEGFGHPPLEAVAQGTPTVAADIAVLREVLADAAVYAPPQDVPAMAAAIRRVLDDTGLRKALVRAGVGRIDTFTWEKTATAVLALHLGLVQRERASS